jgi:hypothetical protein
MKNYYRNENLLKKGKNMRNIKTSLIIERHSIQS